MNPKLIAGIDFGSQLAGTTVICREVEGQIALFRSPKGGAADRFLEEHFSALPPCLIGLDAPLSLPGVYRTFQETGTINIEQRTGSSAPCLRCFSVD